MKVLYTDFPPDHPTMLWDGTCGFCGYWIIKWNRLTKGAIEYQPYQEGAHQFPDIPQKIYPKAVRLFEPNGMVHGGAGAAFRSFSIAGHYIWLDGLYRNSKIFSWVCDMIYSGIAKNRSLMYKITIAIFGKVP